MNKIKKLEEQLRKARQEAEEQAKDKYKYLIGTYLRPAYTAFHYVTSIDKSDGDKVTYGCTSVYIDLRYPDSECGIYIRGFGYIEIEDLDRCIIDKEKFDNAFNEASRRIASSFKIEK